MMKTKKDRYKPVLPLHFKTIAVIIPVNPVKSAAM